MASTYRSQKIGIFVFYLLILSCNNQNNQPLELHTKGFDNNLKSGDIVCRLGNGFFSNRFKKYSVEEKIYSHVGVLENSNDSLFVYHAEASEFTGVGNVKREYLGSFLQDIDLYAFYRIDCSDSIKNKIVTNVKSYYDKDTKFDLDFNSVDDSEVYCTELLAHSINRAFNDSIITPNIIKRGERFYGVDDIYLHENFNLIYKYEKD